MTLAERSMDEEFLSLADPFRGELLAHCYRMMGSVHDAEDLVQETYLRAWRSYDRFEGRSSLRTWLYRIATRVCLTALEGRNRRPMPTGLGGPAAEVGGDIVERHEVPWLDPLPDAMAVADNADPAVIVAARETIRLALIATLQHLPPRQRAVLILRDVLKWRAAEVAEALDTTTTAINSILQRARAHLDELTPAEEEIVEPDDEERRRLLDRYVTAFEAKDIPAIVELFTAEAVWEMPPFAEWYQGRDQIALHLETQCPAVPGGVRMLATHANGQPAFGQYLVGEDGGFHAFNLQVLTPGPNGFTHVANFLDTTLFAAFDLPLTLPAD